MKLPFVISDKDWQELKPRKMETLGQRKDLEPEQEELLNVFRVVDLRVEWLCYKMVLLWNAFIFFSLLFLLINGPKIVEIVSAYYSK